MKINKITAFLKKVLRPSGKRKKIREELYRIAQMNHKKVMYK